MSQQNKNAVSKDDTADTTGPAIVKYKQRKHFPVPMLNKGNRAEKLFTNRWEIFAALMAYTYTLQNREKYKGVVVSNRVRFTSYDEIEGREVLTKYADMLPPPRRSKKAYTMTDRDRIREAVIEGVPCYEIGWFLPSEGPELDQSFFLPLSLVTRHKLKPEGFTSLMRREGDERTGELRDRRFIWTDNEETDEGAIKMGLTVLGSCDLMFPRRQKGDDCLIFIPSDTIAGNFVNGVYEMVVKSEQIKDITNYFAGSRSEVEELEEVDEEEAAQEPEELLNIAKRDTRRRIAGAEPLPPIVDQTQRGDRRIPAADAKSQSSSSSSTGPKSATNSKECAKCHAVNDADAKFCKGCGNTFVEESPPVKPPVQDERRPTWWWCNNRSEYQKDAATAKGPCPEHHVPVFTSKPKPLCATCDEKLKEPRSKERVAKTGAFTIARAKLAAELGYDPEEKWDAEHPAPAKTS